MRARPPRPSPGRPLPLPLPTAPTPAVHLRVSDSRPLPLRSRIGAFWVRHRTLFWTIHSLWALATGVAVILLARERYGFVPWVCLFLVLTWVSTLFFGRRVPAEGVEGPSDGPEGVAPATPGFGEEATSYLMRTMYQETLFFLLPFYAYSTVVGSVNMIFPLALAGLAILSCIDLLFDRWMKTSPTFGLVFFSAVAFAALNLLLPILTPLGPAGGTVAAAMAAVGSAVPLAFRGTGRATGGERLRVGGLSIALLLIPLLLPQVVPPVPLRLSEAVFAPGIDRTTLVPADTLGGVVAPERVEGGLFVLMEVFAPAVMDTRVSLEWTRDGTPIRSSREIEITAHEWGFRVWDAWRPTSGPVPAGTYEVVLKAGRGRMFGRAEIAVQ